MELRSRVLAEVESGDMFHVYLPWSLYLNIYQGTSMVMSPHYFRSDMSFRMSTRVTTRNYVQIPRKVDDVFVVF